jgi:hypothetical protein
VCFQSTATKGCRTKQLCCNISEVGTFFTANEISQPEQVHLFVAACCNFVRYLGPASATCQPCFARACFPWIKPASNNKLEFEMCAAFLLPKGVSEAIVMFATTSECLFLICFNNRVNNKMGLHKQSLTTNKSDCYNEQQQIRNSLMFATISG